MSGSINHHVSSAAGDWDAVNEGAELYRLASELYPICRSITGDGVRETLRLLQKQAPLMLHEVPSGTKIFDWTVPPEWNIREAHIKNSRGEKIVDFRDSSLHIVNYSRPIRKKMTLAELRPHLYTLPESPDWVPYRTTYYKDTWGFCMTHRQLQSLADDQYEVCVDTTLEPGHLTYGEFRIQGATDDEVLISSHCCHPSLGNDNVSGMAVAARLAHHLAGRQSRYSYRFLWVPGTVGSITWLALHESRLANIKHGLVLSCVGDAGPFTYKASRFDDAEIDRIAAHVLKHSGREVQLLDFTPIGYDERQYCSPGINLPVGCFMRTPNGKYPEYHTSADNLTLVNAASLAESLEQLLKIVEALEENRSYVNLNPKCEPQLGRRGLFQQMGGPKNPAAEEAILWVLNFSDGKHSLLEIANRSGFPLAMLATAAGQLKKCDLLREA